MWYLVAGLVYKPFHPIEIIYQIEKEMWSAHTIGYAIVATKEPIRSDGLIFIYVHV